MSEPQPNEERTCPECGATLLTTTDCCWLCHETAPIVATLVAEGPVPYERRAAYQFSLATIMLTLTLLAVLLGTTLMSPGIGFLLVVVVTPAFLRTCIVMARRKARGESISPADKLGSFGVSFALSVAVTLGMMIFLAAIVVVAIFVALDVICAAMMSGGP